ELMVSLPLGGRTNGIELEFQGPIHIGPDAIIGRTITGGNRDRRNYWLGLWRRYQGLQPSRQHRGVGDLAEYLVKPAILHDGPRGHDIASRPSHNDTGRKLAPPIAQLGAVWLPEIEVGALIGRGNDEDGV